MVNRIAIDGMLVRRGVSGVENAIYNLCDTLARHGTEEYTLYMPSHSPRPDVEGPRFRTARCTLPKARLCRILWEQLVLPRRVRRDRAALLHAPGYVAALLSRVPVVITVYDLIALKFPEYCRPTNALNYRIQLPCSIRKAAGIIVPSEVTRRDLVARFPGADRKIRTIPLGISEQFQRCDDKGSLAAVRARYRLPGKFILFVGQHEPKKNLPRLIEAYARLRAAGKHHLPLVLAGSRGWKCDAIDRALVTHGVADHVARPGFIAASDMPALLSLAELFVFPSLYEGFGLPPLEAMACGTPVVVSDRGALPEVVGDAALTVDPERAAEIAEAMECALDNQSVRTTLIRKGRARAATFRWRDVADATEQFYRTIISGQALPERP